MLAQLKVTMPHRVLGQTTKWTLALLSSVGPDTLNLTAKSFKSVQILSLGGMDQIAVGGSLEAAAEARAQRGHLYVFRSILSI